MRKTSRSLVRALHGQKADRPGKYISAKGPTNQIPSAATRLVLEVRLTRLHSRVARGLRQTAFKSCGWKRISSPLCRKSAWLPTTQRSNMVRCISNLAIWTCGCLRMQKFITIGKAGAVIGATVSRITCSSLWMRNNGSRRLRTQVKTTTKREKGQALSLLSEGGVTGRRFEGSDEIVDGRPRGAFPAGVKLFADETRVVGFFQGLQGL